MKTITLATVLTLLSINTASAMAYNCARPSEPRIPSGYTVSERDLQGVMRETQSYQREMQTYMECLEKEADHALRELQAIGRDFERMAQEFQQQ